MIRMVGYRRHPEFKNVKNIVEVIWINKKQKEQM